VKGESDKPKIEEGNRILSHIRVKCCKSEKSKGE
jgi:hypothetical protein